MNVSSKFDRELTSQGLERTALLQLSFQEHNSKEHYISFAGTELQDYCSMHSYNLLLTCMMDSFFFFSLWESQSFLKNFSQNCHYSSKKKNCWKICKSWVSSKPFIYLFFSISQLKSSSYLTHLKLSKFLTIVLFLLFFDSSMKIWSGLNWFCPCPCPFKCCPHCAR